MSGNVVMAKEFVTVTLGAVPGSAVRCRHPKSEGDVMALPFSYEGKRVVVSGGGGAGMGAAAVQGLDELGAEIHVLDLKDAPIKVASQQVVDLREPDAVADAVENIGGH